MKKFYIILVALFLMSSAYAQWVPQNSGTTHNLWSVFFTDANSGYAVGDSGTILKTTDGGTIWISQNSGTLTHLSSIHFPTINTGYVVGDKGTILKTIDGGTNWTLQITDTNYILYSVFFTNSNTGYVVGKSTYFLWGEGIILKTIDGGNCWSNNLTYPYYHFNNVCFPSNDTGFVMGVGNGTDAMGIMLRTTNSGVTWMDTIIEERPVSPCMFTVTIGYAVSADALGETFFLKTTNGWASWILQDLSEWWLWSISFTNVDVGYGIGVSTPNWDYNVIFKTIDGGTNWYIQDSILSGFPYTVYFPSIDTGYIVGENGTILKTTNGGISGTNDQSSKSNTLKIYPTPSSTHITIETSEILTRKQLSIMNLNGQQLLQQEMTEPIITIDVSTLQSGVYIVKFVGENGVQVGKFIKE